MKSTHVDARSSEKNTPGYVFFRMLHHKIQCSRVLYTHTQTHTNHAEGEGWELEYCGGAVKEVRGRGQCGGR